jgi:uncharacterized membrane protein HdeD (DUF308 family)
METLKYRVLSNWNLSRMIRLVMGMIIGMQAFADRSLLLAMLATFILFQAVFAVGCCAGGSCNITRRR